MFAAGICMLMWQMADADGFQKIWSWFGWSNQTLSVFTLWTATVYLVQSKKPFWMTLIPALFMTVVCSTFLLISKQAFGLSPAISYTGSIVVLLIATAWFFTWMRKR